MKDIVENDKIVITGISGKFPQCANVEEFKEALFGGVDLVKENSQRYPAGVMGVPKRSGVLLDIDKFDASFFGIHPKQTDFTDPRHRILLETVYESIIDAGYNPAELRGSKTGVYVAIGSFNCYEEFHKEKSTGGYTIIGANLSVAANRVSYCFDFKGPSFAMDAACSSSTYAFVCAIKDMMLGETDSAIVCGTQLFQHPFETAEFMRLNMLSPEGKCKVFSKNRDGYVRAETVVSYFLQRESKSRRIYATVLAAKSATDGFKEEGITYPSIEEQFILMRNLYDSIKVDPNAIQYVEAHGTGTPVGDIIECESLRKHFCQKRNEPLLIGSVKSNMGHSEVASGLCSLTKAVITMEEGIIPANIHTESLDSTLPGIRENQLKIVTKNTKFNGGIIGVNCFGFGGANTHIVIDSNKKEKSTIVYERPNNRLVQVSGRTEEAVLHFLDGVEKNQDDPEFLAMVDEIHKLNIKGHNYRGYTVLGEHQIKEVGKYNKKRPIWFVYTGMGSQWNKMGRDLLNIPVFKSTINRCARVLEPYGIDLLNVITSEDPKVFDNFINLFCGIGTIEIALTDLLHSLNIYPDGICGHSLGEVGCSYADGQISVEQATLLGYARGYASSNSSIIPGQMAAIGLSKEKVSKMLPEGIFIACQNAKESVTISGPLEETKAFVEQLSAQGIFAKLVNSGGIPYHTKYVKEAGELLLDFCKLVLPDPKPRSEKWVSSSVPESKKHEKWAQLNCAEYHHNNFCNTVLFDQVYSQIPENAIVIEVSPHGLLQAILKREMGPEATQISITNRSSDDNEKFFLSAIGKLYLAGGQPNLRKLYNEVSFPVSRGTKMLSSLVKWDHSVSWFSKRYEHKSSCGISVNVSLSDEEYAYLEGHQIDGRILMPATGYIDLIWNIVADFNLKNKEELPIVMENIKFKRATIVTDGEGVTFTITIMKQSGYFEIFESGAVVCTGYVRIPKDVSSEFKENDLLKVSNNKEITLQEHDIYQECQLRRYMYKNYFRGLSECDLNGRNGKLQWKGKFASFFDTMLHITIIGQYSRESLLPTSIRQITVDPIKHLQMVEKNMKELPITFNTCQNLIKSGGIEIIGTEYSKAPRRQHTQEPPYCESYSLVNYSRTDKNEYDLETAMSIAMQIILQNNTGTVKQIKICEIVPPQGNKEIDPCIKNIMAKQVLSRIEYFSSHLENLKNKFQAIIVNEREVQLEDLNKVVHNLTENGFIIFKGTYENAKHSSLEVIFESIFDNDKMYLLKPTSELSKNYAVLNISNTNLDWLENLKNLGKTDEEKTLYLVSENEDFSGIIGLTKCLLTETTKLRFRAFLIDQHASKFSVDDPFYKNQLKKDLTFNVLRNNNWATYVHLPLKDLNKQNVGNAAVSINTLGDLSTLEWTEMHFEGRRISEESELVYVYYSALNFRDVMIALGKIPIDSNDIVPTNGKRIMGFVNGDGLALQVQCDPYFTWEIPNEWTLREACTIPCVYATCYYGLIMRAQMQPGESILIHAGTGGIGLAAINIALSMGCEVYTTVSTKEKKDFLKSIFPSIKDKNIGNSRDGSFETMINNNTNGRGVDLVLNSLADTLFQASVRCVAPGGRFIEIGKVDLLNSSPIPTNMFLKNTCFHGVHLDKLFSFDSRSQRQVQQLVAKGIADGVVKPLPSILFEENEVESAFRFLASGKHKGKVLIEIRKEELYSANTPIRSVLATPKVCLDPQQSYVVIGGLGGLGLELTGWLIQKGATRIVLNSRRDTLNGLQAYHFRKWSSYENIIVRINTSDTSTEKGAENLITFAQQLGPVGGIFHSALVLRDQFFLNQTKETFYEVFKAKILSAQNIDKSSRKLCPDLNYFVVFSSIATGRGNIGQINYGMANSAMEMLCEKRRREELPAVAIQWGPIGEVGILQKMGIEERVFHDILPQNLDSCLDTLERFMVDKYVIGSSVVISERDDQIGKQKTKTPVEAVAHILGIKNLDTIDKSMTLSQLGLDSLMVTEIKQTLYRNFNIDISPEEIRELTLNALVASDSSKTEDISFGVQVEANTYLVADDPLVKLRDYKNSSTNVFVIHPIEGHVNMLKPLGSRLNATVYGLQCTSESAMNTMNDFGMYFIKKIKEIQPKGPYYLCGYSYGCALGTEIGIQLESAGDQVEIVYIDGSPSVVHEILKVTHMTKGNSIENSREAILENFCMTFPQVEQKEIITCLSNEKSLEKKLQSSSELISKATGTDRLKILISAKSLIQRIEAGFFYKPSKKLSGRILLIRRIENPFSMEDYDLNKVCNQAPQIEKIDGDHKTILLGNNIEKVSDIINKFCKL
ncbi:LOW QUALITY PROTEIN: fatty acid synthase-like [Diabrotica undecimpunctata]|uniref:LOW QUALITY PROTEIN: fatty acid synthase-like n=1 Tax=Diabrotica undecimpunctata TaxID=50387 RepID=UPI003B634263